MVKHIDNTAIPIVLLVTQLERAGAQKIAMLIARYLYQQGYPVKLVFFYDKAGILTEVQQTEPYPVITLAAKQMGASRLSNIGRAVLALWKWYRLLRAFRTAAIITLTHYSNVLGIPLAWIARVPVRIASQRNTLQGVPAWFLRLDAAIANSFLTSRMIAVSATTARFCMEQEGMRPEKIVTILNGIAIQDYALSPEERQATLVELRASWNIPAAADVIVTVARLHSQKGHRYLIEAAQKLVEHRPDIVFLLIGDGEERQSLEALIRSHGLADSFRLLGTRSDIPALLGAADLFVLPSLYEGLPNSLLEAMAARVPVIATAVGGVPEVLTDGETGLLVAPGDADLLYQAMDTLLGDSDYRERLAQAAYTHVRSHFSDEAMLVAYEKMLIDHLSQRHGAGR